MRLVHSNIEKEFIFDDHNHIYEIIIENKKYYSKFLYDLYLQKETGAETPFILSDRETYEPLNIIKTIEIIIDPLQINENNKTVQVALQKILKEKASEEDLYLKTNEMVGLLNSYADFLIEAIGCSFEFSSGSNILSLIKALDIKIDIGNENYIERLFDYVNVIKSFTDVGLFVFAGLRNFLETQEFVEFCKMISYEKMNVIFIGSETYPAVESAKRVVIDSDLCEI
jgi:CRISPR type II-A-associated protein Csn2